MAEKIAPLRINKKLPQIVLPQDKNDYFIKWYDDDLRFQDNIPKSFERGYLFLEGNLYSEEQLNDNNYKELFKTLAKVCKTTYRIILR